MAMAIRFLLLKKKVKGQLKSETCTVPGEECNHAKHQCCGRVRAMQSNQPSSLSSSGNLDRGVQECVTCTDSSEGSSTQMAVTPSSNHLRRSHSCFSFIPDNISFRLSRTSSLGSLGSCSLFSTRLSLSNTEGEISVQTCSSNLDDRNENLQCDGCVMLPCTNTTTATLRQGSISAVSCVDISEHPHNEDIFSSQDAPGTNNNMRISSPVNGNTQRNHEEIGNTDRRTGVQEIVDGSVRFSRTMSVGRLRDRVLRRTPSSDLLVHLHDDRVEGVSRLVNDRRFLHGVTRRETSDGNSDMPLAPSEHYSSTFNSMNSIRDYEVESPQMRGVSNRALVAHRTAFLERRRRIRSQFRALQRLGSRFENLSGHDRSCILSGQHRTGRCMCRGSGRAANPENPEEDTSTRASISRIVMLAEALFEVLDEIHQQSVVLSTRPSISSIGSVPAPKEVVDCMPVKLYTKTLKHQNDEASQCYICLVEYDEGDCMRVLPCLHDFHQTCIDKWLKEIHRVCPLCRRDVCQPDMQAADKVD